jgi:hypothetical protein
MFAARAARSPASRRGKSSAKGWSWKAGEDGPAVENWAGAFDGWSGGGEGNVGAVSGADALRGSRIGWWFIAFASVETFEANGKHNLSDFYMG